MTAAAPDRVPSTRERILGYLERKPDRTFTPKQLARWTGVTERTALRHLLALKSEGVVQEHDDA